MATDINRDDFLGISFSHHMEILNKTKDINTVLFYIHETVMHRWAKKERRKSCGALLGENSSKIAS